MKSVNKVILLGNVTRDPEVKSTAAPEAGRMFNDLYSSEGILRFMTKEHAYAKGCKSASMIGYMQNMEPDDILAEVNQFATARGIPSLSRAAKAWQAKEANRLVQTSLDRQFEEKKIELTHFWIDLRHCTFDVLAGEPPQSANPVPPGRPKKPKKTTVRKTRTMN